MKLAFALAACALLSSLFATAVGAAETSAEKSRGSLLHVVAIKFKPSATAEQIKAVESAFAGLKQKVPGIQSLKWGTNVSPEKHDKGFTHGFILSFGDEESRNAYLVHPAHKEFGKILGPVMDDVFVIDFWTKE